MRLKLSSLQCNIYYLLFYVCVLFSISVEDKIVERSLHRCYRMTAKPYCGFCLIINNMKFHSEKENLKPLKDRAGSDKDVGKYKTCRKVENAVPSI